MRARNSYRKAAFGGQKAAYAMAWVSLVQWGIETQYALRSLRQRYAEMISAEKKTNHNPRVKTLVVWRIMICWMG